MSSDLENFPEEPPRTEIFTVELSPDGGLWFQFRITVDDRSAWVDNAVCGEGEGAVLAMEITGDYMGKGTAKGFIVFDDEGLDEADLHIIERMDGWSRVHLTYEPGPLMEHRKQWLPLPSHPKRIDVLVRTQQLIAEFQRATAAFRLIDRVEPREIERFGHSPTLESLFTPPRRWIRQPDGSMKQVPPVFTPPWQNGDDPEHE